MSKDIKYRGPKCALEYSAHWSTIPYRKLFAAMVDRAVLDLRNTETHIRTRAAQWIFSNNMGEWSIYWCLDKLDLELMLEDIREQCRFILDGQNQLKAKGKSGRTRSCSFP